MTDNKLGLQDYLSFGYLYLLLLGIARESIYYGMLGVNIMSYSNVMDILLSPVVYLTKHPSILGIFIAFAYWMAIQPKFHKKHREKKWYSKLFDVQKRDQIYAESSSDSDSKNKLIPKEIVPMALVVASLLLGTGVGAGSKVLSKMESNQLEMRNILKFVDGEQKVVRILGQNSNYVFYVKEGDSSVSISPIAGVVKVIEQNNEKP